MNSRGKRLWLFESTAISAIAANGSRLIAAPPRITGRIFDSRPRIIPTINKRTSCPRPTCSTAFLITGNKGASYQYFGGKSRTGRIIASRPKIEATDKMSHLLFTSFAPNVFEISCGSPKLRAAPYFSRSKAVSSS